MFWQDDTHEEERRIPDDVIDLIFNIDCRQLPVDHAYALGAALEELAPWLEDEPKAAVHTIHVAGSQNGWERPEHGRDQLLLPSRRTKLAVRIPREREQALQDALQGTKVQLDGYPLVIGQSKRRLLSRETTLLARHVATVEDLSENQFLSWAAAEFKRRNINLRKAMCGKQASLFTPNGDLFTRSLMLAGLTPEESLQLQQYGLGPNRLMGCGIFLPHKGIDAVTKTEG